MSLGLAAASHIGGGQVHLGATTGTTADVTGSLLQLDGEPGITEMDAMIAYLQMLGTLVDFSTFVPDETR